MVSYSLPRYDVCWDIARVRKGSWPKLLQCAIEVPTIHTGRHVRLPETGVHNIRRLPDQRDGF